MPIWRSLIAGLRVLLRRNDADRDIADELQHYLDEATAERVDRGVARAEATRGARLEIGGAIQVREQVRDAGWEAVVGTTLADLRYAARRLRAAPGFTAVTVLTLAIGVGATTTIFSAVKPILLDPPPYPHADRITMILENGRHTTGTFGMFRGLRASREIEALAVFKAWQPTLTGLDRPERLEGQRVSAEYFRVLGVAPIAGRDFTDDDDRVNGPNVVIMGDTMWRRRFGADPAIVGRQIRLGDDLFTVVGVMPASFENVLAPAAAIWAPLQYDAALPAQGREWGHHLSTIARLHPGVAVEEASRDVNRLGRAVLRDVKPATYDPATQFAAAPLQAELTRAVRPALLIITAAVVVVLLMACVNVTNLLLARGVQRHREFAVRAALGAGSGRLVRQLLTESLLLAAMGGAAGAATAVAGVRAVVALSPPGLPRMGAIGVDVTTLAFGIAITAAVGLACGLVPAFQAAASEPQDGLHGTRHTASGHRRTRRALVVAEVALAIVLLVSSGLLLRSMTRLFAVPAGFESPGLLTMRVLTIGHQFDDTHVTLRFFDRALDAVRRVPGVTSAAWTSQLPLSGDRDQYGAHFDAGPSQPAVTYPVFRYAVSPGYVETMGIALRRGRTFDARDSVDAPPVALISESLARARFRDGDDPIGQRVRIGSTDDYTIVGVVGDVKQLSLAAEESEAVYTPASQWRFGDRSGSIVVRGRGDLTAMAPAVRDAVWSVDRDQPVLRVATTDALLAASAEERRFVLTLFEAFALAALVLAAAGIYGVLAGSVAERTREIGVRSALGASRGDILVMVLRQGTRLSAIGMLIGLAGAAAAGRAMSTLLFGISSLDPATYVSVVALLGAVTMVAGAVPAWRAALIDPATTLRSD